MEDGRWEKTRMRSRRVVALIVVRAVVIVMVLHGWKARVSAYLVFVGGFEGWMIGRSCGFRSSNCGVLRNSKVSKFSMDKIPGLAGA